MSQASAGEAGRGREASKVGDIPTAGWKDVLWRTYHEVVDDHVLLIAAGVTFYALLATVPALTALVSIYGLFADPQTLNEQLDLLQGFIPDDALGIVREQLTRLTQQGGTRLGVTSLISLGIALWSANAGMKALFEAMNVAYDEEEKRSYLKLTAMTLGFTLATIVVVLLMLGLVVVLPPLLELFGFGGGAQWAVRLGGLVVVFALMTAGLATLYRWGPSREVAKWRWITPGAALAVAVTLIASGLFSWYIASFGSYNATYGSLGAIFGLMTWLWITATIVIVGAELNAETEHQTRRDTTSGLPRPLGQRGATMADTVGAAYGEAAAPERGTTGSAGRRGRRRPAAERLPLGRLALLAGLAWLQGRWKREPDPAAPDRQRGKRRR